MARTFESNYAGTFTADQIAKRPTEVTILSRIVNALKNAGDPVVKVWDGEEESPVLTTGDVMHLAFNLDELHLYTKSGAFVFLVMGQDYDMLTDYSVSLEEALTPVNNWIDKHMN